MTWHFRFRIRSALHRSLFRRSDQESKMQLTPRSLATNSSGSSKSYRTGRASPLLDDEMRISEKRADAVLAHQQRGSRKRSSASARQKTSFASSTTRVKEIFFAFRLVKIRGQINWAIVDIGIGRPLVMVMNSCLKSVNE